MKNKKLAIIISSIVILLIIIGAMYFNVKGKNISKVEKNEVSSGDENIPNEVFDFISSIAGVRANNIEIINNPVGFKGELFAPIDSISNGVDYFLENTENEKMENLKIDIKEDLISIYVNYKVTKNIKTPIELIISPSLNENEDLVINIDEVKFLDIKIADFIVNIAVNSFIKDWFPSESDLKIDFNKGNVVIYKENLKGIVLKNVSVESEGLKINAIINLEDLNS
ncbi:MAG: hypothetical protein ACRDA5_03560 [Clostridium sp.]